VRSFPGVCLFCALVRGGYRGRLAPVCVGLEGVVFEEAGEGLLGEFASVFFSGRLSVSERAVLGPVAGVGLGLEGALAEVFLGFSEEVRGVASLVRELVEAFFSLGRLVERGARPGRLRDEVRVESGLAEVGFGQLFEFDLG